MKRRVIDKRRKHFVWLDDEYLNGYAKLCGINATGVYLLMCRHADANQECFPSIKLMCQKLGISHNTVKKAIKTLEEWNIIEVQRSKTRDGRYMNNVYIMLNKEEWKNKPDQGHEVATVKGGPIKSPEPSGDSSIDHEVATVQGHVVAHKKIQRQEDTYKNIDTNVSIGDKPQFGREDINQLMELFTQVNPTMKRKKQQRWACKRLIDKVGIDAALNAARYGISIQGEQYTKSVLTPTDLEEHFTWLKTHYAKNHNKKSQILIL